MIAMPVQEPAYRPVQAGAENIAGRRGSDQKPRIIVAARDQPRQYKLGLRGKQRCGREGDAEKAKIGPNLHHQRGAIGRITF